MNQKTYFFRRWIFLLSFLLLLFILSSPVYAFAASKPAAITNCKLTSSNKVKITATINNTQEINGKKVYLFALSLSDSKLTQKMKPISNKNKTASMSFSVPLNQTKLSSKLYSRFVLASKNKNGTYTAISNECYISNPKKAAKYTYRFPTASSKKGLQVSASMLEDAIELNVSHSTINIVFTEMISSKTQHNKSVSIPYKYHGTTYWFRKSVINSYDRQLTALKENNTTISAILLLGWRNDLKNLIYPSGRKQGHSFYAWNTSSPAAREHLQAAISFLASRYGTRSAKHGRIVNWIVGNEVNNYKVYNYAGKKTLQQYAQIYANAFRLTYNTVTSIYSNARVYISLDHLWNTNTVSGTYPSRKMLDAFAAAINRQGNIPWNLAYHPYSSPLTEPKFWENANQQLTQALTSPVINMGNIDLLTTYIRQTYGSGTRIILSEQGYTSVRHNGKKTSDVQKEQSAAIAYSYYLTESNDMIDSFIMNRHVDHDTEVKQGLNLGLWTTDQKSSNPEWADLQKDSWNVFKYMDTNYSESVTSDSLSLIGVNSWSDVVSNFSTSLYSKNSLDFAPLEFPDSYKKTASLSSKWKKYGASGKQKITKAAAFVTRDNSRNRNSLWGFSQSFKKGINFSRHSYFYTTLKVKGYTGSKVWLKLRFYSGKNILESTGLIDTGRNIAIGVNLSDWKYKKSITKIKILLSPAGGKWKNNALFEMFLPVRGK